MTDEDEPESPINLEGPAVEPESDKTHMDHIQSPRCLNQNLKGQKTKIKEKAKSAFSSLIFSDNFKAVNRGTKTAPIALMISYFIHDWSKSKTMMTCVHHLGYCVSYPK